MIVPTRGERGHPPARGGPAEEQAAVTTGVFGTPPESDPSTLGELLLAFSTVSSVGLGFGTDHGIRTCYIGMCLAPDLELSPQRTADLYYAALAKDGGCVCGANQMAEFLGANERDELSDLVRRNADNELEMLRWLFRHAGRGGGPRDSRPPYDWRTRPRVALRTKRRDRAV